MPSRPAKSSGQGSSAYCRTASSITRRKPQAVNGHYTAAELQGKMVPDEHVHERATCVNIRGKGLVVISSCGHVGVVNSVRQAQQVSRVQISEEHTSESQTRGLL